MMSARHVRFSPTLRLGILGIGIHRIGIHRIGIHRIAVLLLAILVLAAAAPDRALGAERHDVIGRTFEFFPRDITIAPGDTVQWIWEFGTHTVTEGEDCVIDDPLFNAELTGSNPTFRYVFDTPGVTEYFCIPHCVIQDMKGTVTVAGDTDGRVYEADPDGSQMVPPVETDATAKLRAYLAPGQDRLHVQVAVENLVNEMIGCHLHLGPPGSNGPMIANLGIFEDSLAVDIPLQPVYLDPLREGGIYVAIHTAPYPVGEIRGQLSPVAATALQATLDPSQSTNPVDSGGVGFAQVYVWPDSSRLHIDLEVWDLTAPVNGCHIHEAPPGEDGPIRFDLGAFDGRIVRDFATTPAEIATLLAGGYYVNVHTEQYLFGEIRGQIGAQDVSSVPDGNGPPRIDPWDAPGSVNPTARDPFGLSIQPTVSSGRIELRFELPRSDDVRVELFEASGRRIGSVQLPGREGRNLVPLDLEREFGAGLRRGRTYLRLSSGGAETGAEFTLWK